MEARTWPSPAYPKIGKITGKTQIVATWIAAMAQYPGIIFVSTPGSIVIDGSEAVVRSYTSEVFDHRATGKTTRGRGRYDDLLVKRAGQWLFQRRRLKKLRRKQ